jgi:50S ribosomal protein L16 3-hydroxylase
MSLHRLFGLDGPSFLERHWPAMPLVVQADVARFGALAALDVDAFMRAGPPDHPCLVYLEDDPSWLDDRDMPMASARRFLVHGNCVEIGGLQHLLPAAADVLRALNTDMGQLPDQGDCSLFCKSGGKGTPPHFDRTEVFVIQLQGRTTWRIAPNRAVSDPSKCHYLAEQQSPPAELLEQLTPGELLPRVMPDDSQVIDVVAGTALFLPRGHLHETLDSDGSVSLTFSTLLPTAAEVFARVIHRHLLGQAAWRRPMAGLLADGRVSPQSMAELERLVKALVADGDALPNALRALQPLIPALVAAGRTRR